MKRIGMRCLPWQLRTGILLVLILAIGVLARELVPRMLRAQSVHFTDGLLLTTNRDRLALCVEPVAAPTVDLEVARQRMDAALATLTQHPHWRPAGLAQNAPVVEIGCPGKPYLLEPGVSVKGGKPTGDPVAQRVDVPSRFRVFVYILPEPELARIFGDTSIRRAPQEMFCEGDSCAEVTTGLYLSPREVHDAPFLSDQLAKVIGLELAKPLDPGSPRPDGG
uniref:Uncharacterized protein n=1 Tax=Thermorudis peleae TaxID=1382356 RepID=A0A831X2F6_9BACT